MNMHKIHATALLLAALILLALFCVSTLVVCRVYFEVNYTTGSHFFRICLSTSNAECISFTWVHLMAFSLVSLIVGALLTAIGVKKWRTTRA